MKKKKTPAQMPEQKQTINERFIYLFMFCSLKSLCIVLFRFVFSLVSWNEDTDFCAQNAWLLLLMLWLCVDFLCCYLSIHTLNSLYASCVPNACGPVMGAKRAHCVHFVCANKKKDKWNSVSKEKTEDETKWKRRRKKLNELMLIIDKLHTAKVIQHCVLRQKNSMHIQLDSGLCCPLVVQPHWVLLRERERERTR